MKKRTWSTKVKPVPAGASYKGGKKTVKKTGC